MSPFRARPRRRRDAAVAEMVESVRGDTRWDRLRTRPARLTIVTVMVLLLLLLALPVAWVTLPALADLGLPLVAVGVW